MAFLDEDELQPAGPGGPRRPGGERQRQLMLRRVIALSVGVLLIVLLLLAVRGCLNARKERGFESYVSDLTEIVNQSNQLSTEFFTRLEDPSAGGGDSLELEAQIASDRGTAESLLQRVEGLDTPDELASAQAELEQAFELRRDGLAGIAEDIPTALGDEGRDEALDGIAADMRAFLASDVLFARAHAEITSTLADEGVSGEIPASVFLPDPVDRWLDKLQLATILSTFAGDAGATEGIHGLAVLDTTINKTPLTAGAENTVSLGSGTPKITIEVENQGDQEESDVTVSYAFSGGVLPLEGEGTIPALDAGGFEELTLEFEEPPDTDVPLTLQVEVLPVPGEEDSTNNEATYTVIFN